MSIDTVKMVNLAQLDSETGGAGLRCVELGGTCTIESLGSVSDSDLQAAVESHIAGPADTRTVDEKLAVSGLTVSELRSALGL